MLKSLIISPRSGLETEGLFEREEGSFNLVKIMVAVHKELECAKVQKPRHMKLEFINPKIKNKSNLVACEYTIPDQPTWRRVTLKYTGTAEGEGLVGPWPYHFLVPPPPLFALKRKIIKIKKDLKQFFFRLYSAIFSVFSLISKARRLRLRSAACFVLPAPPEFFISFIRRNENY